MVPELLKMARLYKNLDRPHETATMYERAISIFGKSPRKNAYPLALLLNNLAILYTGWEKNEEAVTLYSRAVSVIKEADLIADPKSVVILQNALQLFRQTGAGEKVAELEALMGVEPETAE